MKLFDTISGFCNTIQCTIVRAFNYSGIYLFLYKMFRSIILYISKLSDIYDEFKMR